MGALRCAALALLCGALAGGPLPADDATILRIPALPESRLLHKVTPEYPALALQRHIQGVVRFSALIGRDGRIKRLTLVSGHPLLVPAARQAARQWVYRPQMLHGTPVRVMAQIEVRFRLDERGRPVREDAAPPDVAVAR